MSSRCARLSRLFGVCKSFQLTCQFALRVTLALTGKDPIATDREMTKIRICLSAMQEANCAEPYDLWHTL